jgi:hypothetical protein
MNNFLYENLKSGKIRPSKSPMASPVFFAKRRMDLYGLSRIIGNIIGNSMQSPFQTDILYFLSQISSDTLQEPSILFSWMFNGDTTVFKFMKEMNRRLLSAPIIVSLNP